MIVYLHNPSHEATDRFVRGTLLSQQMRQFVERNDILMWGASVRSQEGYKGTHNCTHLRPFIFYPHSGFLLISSYDYLSSTGAIFSFAVYKFAVRLTNKGIQFPVSKKLAVFAFAGNQQKNSGFKVRQFLPVSI